LCTCVVFFFFQAEDGIRDWSVTGVQTCALPIYPELGERVGPLGGDHLRLSPHLPRVRGRGGAGRPRQGRDGARGDDGSGLVALRSEERRVGKEGRSGWGAEQLEERRRGGGGGGD